MALISFYNKDKDKEKKQNNKELLAYSLAQRDNTPIDIGSVQPMGQQNNEEDISQGTEQFLNGALKLGNSLRDSGFFGSSADSGNGVWSNAANNYISGNTSSFGGGSAISNAINGGGNSGSVLTSAINTEAGGAFGNGGEGGGGASSLPWGQIANMGKGLYNNISGKTPEEYSDLEQSTIYPLQGAANGYSYGGPWGALGGALYGLGYSFKDDMGLKDSNFLTQMLYPIGMGDGGGLRIGGESVLDIL